MAAVESFMTLSRPFLLTLVYSGVSLLNVHPDEIGASEERNLIAMQIWCNVNAASFGFRVLGLRLELALKS